MARRRKVIQLITLDNLNSLILLGMIIWPDKCLNNKQYYFQFHKGIIMFNKTNLALVALASSVSLASHAGVYNFTDSNANNGGRISDRLESISTTYDEGNSSFKWETTFNSSASDVDGFWLVVNNGPNPKYSDVNELAIMYGDLASGTLTTYVYNGRNRSDSNLNPGILLQTDTFTVTDDGFSIDIDVSAINAWGSPDDDYSGIQFDNKIGAWFHISTDSSFEYNEGGDLERYSFGAQGWYDTANLTATKVPEPGVISLLALGLAGLTICRRKEK